MTADASTREPAAMLAVVLLCGIAGLVFGAEHADSRPGASGPGAEPTRQISYSPHLRANASNTERYVVNGVCERQGVRQISRILKRSRFEEMWAFLPRAHGTGRCQWHEIGRDEKSMDDGATLRVDMAYLEALMADNTEIHLVHFHPLRYFECAAQASCPREKRAGESEPFDPRWVTDLVFSMPSPSDVHFMMDMTWRFQRRHQGRGTMRHKVVTPYGVVSYGLTEQGVAKFDAERHSRSEGLYIAWVVAGALADERVEQVIEERSGSIFAAVQRLAQALNTGFLWVAHSPPPGR
jgi:hypothetical protein